jgi:hypothetical protein
MCQLVCFEAGRFPQIQSSWTALCCSRKWMSGPADALAPFQRDRKRSIVALTVGFIIQALQILLGSAGRSVFSLDKYLSWMSQGLPHGKCSPRDASYAAEWPPPSLDLGDEASYLDQPLDEAACSAGY